VTLCLAATVVYTLADLGSKAWAEGALSTERAFEIPPACTPNDLGQVYAQRGRGAIIVLVPGYLEFRYAENCGGAFGMLHDAPTWVRTGVFLGAGIVFIGVLGALFVRGSGGTLFAASVPLIASGALGNMVDRVRLGYVVDFIHFHIHDSFHWPTFNVADITITVGGALLVLDGLRRVEPATTPASPPASQTPGA
jgi:signal peptidase II